MEHNLSVLFQLHLHSRLKTWLQWIGQRQDEKHLHVGFGAPYIRDLMVFLRKRLLGVYVTNASLSTKSTHTLIA